MSAAGLFHTRRLLAVMLMIAALLFLGARWWLWTQMRQYERTQGSHATWTTGGQRGVVRIAVVDYDTGQPAVPFAEIWIDSHSGWQVKYADENGVAKVPMGSDDVRAVEVEGVRVIDRPHSYYLGPSGAEGLDVRVRLKGGANMPGSQKKAEDWARKHSATTRPRPELE